MICPYCGANDDKVIDSRLSEAGRVIRRRRECVRCAKRFTTYERVEQTARLMVVKRDGTRVPFNSENILRGIVAACGKRPVSEETKRRIVDEIEEEVHREFDREVESRVIGQRVLHKLRDADEVAYIRFASEYLDFKNAREMLDEIETLGSRPRDVKDQQKLF